jgi:hypothetical protein
MNHLPGEINATVSAGGEQRNIILRPAPDAPDEYMGELRDFAGTGQHQLTVDLDLPSPTFTPTSESAQSTFSRIDGVWNRPQTYYAIAALILLFIATLIYRYFAVRTNPVTGTLVFEDGSVQIPFPIASRKNWKVIKGKTLTKSYPQLQLKHIKIRNPRKKRKRGSNIQSDDLQPLSLDSMESAAVKIDYTTANGKRHKVTLPPNSPTEYYGIDGYSLYQMTYKPPDSR